jgi:hypothetical protein
MTSYLTPSNYNLQNDISSAYYSHHLYQHAPLPSFPNFADKKEEVDS